MEIYKKCPIEKVVSIDPRLFESLKGHYFIGQTKTFTINKNKFAWAGLINPCNSNVKLFISEFTVSNFSSEPFLAQIWLNTMPPDIEFASKSNKVSPANTTIVPPPIPRVEIKYIDEIFDRPTGGVNIFNRIISPEETAVDSKDGEIIIPPGGSFILFFPGAKIETDLMAAFGWWEEEICLNPAGM